MLKLPFKSTPQYVWISPILDLTFGLPSLREEIPFSRERRKSFSLSLNEDCCAVRLKSQEDAFAISWSKICLAVSKSRCVQEHKEWHKFDINIKKNYINCAKMWLKTKENWKLLNINEWIIVMILEAWPDTISNKLQEKNMEL